MYKSIKSYLLQIKHGSGSFSSMSGSADLLAAWGIYKFDINRDENRDESFYSMKIENVRRFKINIKFIIKFVYFVVYLSICSY